MDQQINSANDPNHSKRSLSDGDINLEDEPSPKRSNNAEPIQSAESSPGIPILTTFNYDFPEKVVDTSNICSPTTVASMSTNRTREVAAVDKRFTGDFNFKLHTVLPQQILKDNHDQSEGACTELCDHLSKMLPESPTEGQLNELDLTLPSSYANLFNNNSQFLYQLLSQPIEKYPKSKVIRFPEMKLEIMSELIKKLQDIITSAAYDIVCLSFILIHGDRDSNTNTDVLKKIVLALKSHVKPQVVDIKTMPLDNSFFDSKKLNTDIKNKKLNVKIKINAEQPKAVQKIPKLNKGKKKFQLPADSAIQFGFDSYLLSPVTNQQALPFTAYNYWRLDEAHKIGYTGKGINVAIIDTGIYSSHPAFNETAIFQPMITQFPTDVCNDLVGHGTFCAGIICGKGFTYNTKIDGNVVEQFFPPGIAPGAQPTVYKVTDIDCSSVTFLDDIVKALESIANENIDVVNISLGTLVFSPKIAKAIGALVDKGVIVVCAASNLGHKFRQSVCYPARLGNVLCIGSHGPHGKPSQFSPVGQEIDFLAPGENITGPSNYEYLNGVAIGSGTSFAAPAVAGLVCLILQFIKEKAATSEEYEYYRNHWIMKEILRKMSTCPGRHSDDRGFGALGPWPFFHNPLEFINSLLNQEVCLY